jgi:hypothetical protein
VKIEWDGRLLTDEEVAEHDFLWRYGRDLEGEAWRSLFVHQCPGHDWYLHIDPDDGVWLTCRKCPAGVDDVYPDGIDMLTGEFEVFPGYVLGLQTGSVQVNGQESYGAFAYGWRGPVTVDLHVEKYTSMDWIGEEYDAWIEVDPRADPAA